MKINTILIQTSLIALAASISLPMAMLTKRNCDDDFDACIAPYLAPSVPYDKYSTAYDDCTKSAYSKASCKTDGSQGSLCVSPTLYRSDCS